MTSNKIIIASLSCYLLFSASGCAIFMAANQPSRKNLDVLTPGTNRATIIAEIGKPIFSEEKDGAKTEIYSFKQGYTTPVKVGRVLLHSVADLFSYCLWELVATPTEMVFNGKEIKVKITYDKDDRIDKVEYLETEKPKEAAPKGIPTATQPQKEYKAVNNFSPANKVINNK